MQSDLSMAKFQNLPTGVAIALSRRVLNFGRAVPAECTTGFYILKQPKANGKPKDWHHKAAQKKYKSSQLQINFLTCFCCQVNGINNL